MNKSSRIFVIGAKGIDFSSPAAASPQEVRVAGTPVRVTDFGETFTTHDGFIKRLGLCLGPSTYVAGFCRGNQGSVTTDGERGVVLNSIDNGSVYSIKMNKSSRIFVIGAKGIDFS
jgi:hypothetical protein